MSRQVARQLGVAIIATIGLFVVATMRSDCTGEEASSSKGDPILADLKVTGKTEWQANTVRQGKQLPPCLLITVTVQGTAAEQACAGGELRLESLIDARGKSYRWECRSYPSPLTTVEPMLRNGDYADPSGFDMEFLIANRPAIELIRELRGSVALVTGGQVEQVVLDNALSKVADPTKEEADPDEFGTLVRDRRLEVLGVKVDVKRQTLSESLKKSGVKDQICVTIDPGPQSLVRCEILDARGKPISDVSHFDSWPGPEFVLAYQTKSRLPRDAKLRVTLRKHTRKVRVPFVVRDVAVPKIDESRPGMNVPALPDDAYVEAETLAPGDPLLAALKWKSQAKWLPGVRPKAPLEFTVDLVLDDVVASRISDYGELDLESAVDDAGRPLHLSLDRMSGNGEMTSRIGAGDEFQVTLWASEARPIKRVRELRGAMSVGIGESREIVVVKDFLKNAKKDRPVDDPQLTALGIVATVERERGQQMAETVRIELQWKRSAVIQCAVCDGEKGVVLSNGMQSHSILGSRGVSWWAAFEQPLPANAELRLVVVKNTRKVRVPIRLRDISVPEMPDAATFVVPLKESGD